MAETGVGGFGPVKAILTSAAAGFAFGEAALFAVSPALTREDGVLLNAATLSAERAGSTGVGVVAACLTFTSLLESLGGGFLLAYVAMKLCSKAGLIWVPWLVESAAGASVVLGSVATGVLAGVLPPSVYIATQCALVLFVYSYSNINDMTTALLIIFTTLYLSVLYGRLGFIVGLFVIGLTISMLCALRKALTERMTPRPPSENGCRLLERIFFYSVFVGILGFSVGLGVGQAGDGPIAEEVVSMLESVLWVVFLSAGLLGAGLGTVVSVGIGPEMAGKVSAACTVMALVSLRVILQLGPSLGIRSVMGGSLGAATAAGVSLGAASVSAKHTLLGSRNSALAVLGSVFGGAVLAMRGATLQTTSEPVTIALVAVGAFVLGAPKSPFHTQVNLRRGLLVGPELILDIGMETVTSAAAPIGAGALGAAALGTAALGRLGTVGVLVTISLALGSTLSGRIGRLAQTTSARTETD